MKTTISRASLARSMLVALTVACFAMGGGARDDIVSLLLLRPLAMLALMASLLVLTAGNYVQNRWLMALAGLFPLLILLQLVPLPPAVWHSLPGRELAAQIDLAVGIDGIWRPLSLVPSRTVNALLACSVPLAGLLLAIAVPRRQQQPLVILMLVIVVVSAVIGLLQTIGGTGNGFYFYRITNSGSAVGLFANRNHDAILLALAFPLIATVTRMAPATAEQVRPREWFAAGAAVMMVPFLLATGSRAGIGLGGFGLVAGFWIYMSPGKARESRRAKQRIDPRLVFAGLAVIGISLMSALLTETSALTRLERSSRADDELRFQVWGPIARMVGDYFPFGSGVGTFVETYAIHEPDARLSPNYLNHAHNDWLEWALTGGLPLLILIVVATFVVVRRGQRAMQGDQRSTDLALRRLGLSVVMTLGLGSVYDYPLRVPSLALLFAIAVVWLAGRDATPEVGTARAT